MQAADAYMLGPAVLLFFHRVAQGVSALNAVCHYTSTLEPSLIYEDHKLGFSLLLFALTHEKEKKSQNRHTIFLFFVCFFVCGAFLNSVANQYFETNLYMVT